MEELTRKDRTYFNIAREVARSSDFPKIQIGCVAVYQHKIISTGFNSNKTHPRQKEYNKYRFPVDAPGSNHTCHAELSCLVPLMSRHDIDFRYISLYVYREYSNGQLAIARPCESCYKLIKDLGIRNIYYTTQSGYSHEIILEER